MVLATRVSILQLEIKGGRFKRGQRVLFIHTGGIFGLLGVGEEWRFYLLAPAS